LRPGTAYDLKTLAGQNDWSKITNCFQYGYQDGFMLKSCSDVHVIGCASDRPSGIPSTGVAFGVETSNKIIIDRPISSQYGIGVLVDNLPSYPPTYPLGSITSVRINSASIYDSDICAIRALSGRPIIHNAQISEYGGGSGLGIDLRSRQGADIIDCHFIGLATPIDTSNAFDWKTLSRSTIRGNKYEACSSTIAEQQLHSNAATTVKNLEYYSSGGTGLLVNVRAAAGSLESPASPVLFTELFRLTARIYQSANLWNPSAQIAMRNIGVPSASNSAGAIFFSTTDSGSTTLVDRIKFNEDGSVFPLADNAYIIGTGAFRWSAIWAANGTIQTSDARTKTDIQDATLGLDFIKSLRPVSYRFLVGGTKVLGQQYLDKDGNPIPDGAPIPEDATPGEIITEDRPGNRTHWGLVAQEVKAAVTAQGVDFAGWLLTDKDDPDSQQALRYDQFIAPLIKGVQELAAKVEKLEKQRRAPSNA
jgi:hypothetical protein